MGQTAPKNKGKISRMLAAKASLCVRVDALGEDVEPVIGMASRAKVEERVRQCEQGQLRRVSGTGKARAQAEKYTPKRYRNSTTGNWSHSIACTQWLSLDQVFLHTCMLWSIQ